MKKKNWKGELKKKKDEGAERGGGEEKKKKDDDTYKRLNLFSLLYFGVFL